MRERGRVVKYIDKDSPYIYFKYRSNQDDDKKKKKTMMMIILKKTKKEPIKLAINLILTVEAYVI